MIYRVIPLLLSISLMLVNSYSAADTVQIPLSGIASLRSATELSVNPPILDTGNVEIGTSKEKEFSITNTGESDDAPIEIYSLEIGGEDYYEYTSDFPGYISLKDGESVNFSVSFNPTTLGSKKAFLRIEHSGGNSPHMVFLTGEALDIPASELTLSNTQLDFGSVETNTNATQTLTLTNASDANYPAINIYNLLLSGDSPNAFSTDFNNVVTINPGASITINGTMNSGVAGSKDALMTIEHDGSNPSLRIGLSGTVTLPPEELDPTDPVDTEPAITPVFLNTTLNNTSLKKPTALQFGPDGKLYVAERDGFIMVYTVDRFNKLSYTTTATEVIDLVQTITNHDDDGQVNNTVGGRLVTGILVTGTANNPVIYVASGDPRMAAGPSGEDANLDTNSVILSRLTKNGDNWTKLDLVRGLPRSEENHQGNGMQLSKDGGTLYVAMGGHTNMGIPSNNFARLPEYALSAAIVEVDLNAIGNTTYDLPTLDDEDRNGANDDNDPFGGNNGKNMAILTNNGPVQIYSPGYRNAYDLVISENNQMYTVDNGPNSGWGDEPTGSCLNTYIESGGTTYGDSLHHISNKGYFGGHPNPTRGNKSNTFNDSNPQTPIQGAANATECQYKIPDQQNNSLYVFNSSTNGLAEYTASNFGGAMKGDLLAASFDQSIYRVQLNNAGTALAGIDKFFTDLATPLDVTAQGDTQIFPGTVWVADFGQSAIIIYEPDDY